ncbi:hypothetical protein [Cupriavidus pampae]|uniref:hypothetical protein n=1 Tax=Cupriavidus pampae TaxID=659251 RepID=UPI001CC53CB5|nr:hypothetical protein [Cupriavidus pampae]
MQIKALRFTKTVGVAHISVAASLLAEAGLKDAEVARHVDLAREILRRRRLMLARHPFLSVHCVPGLLKAITYVFPVRLSSDQTFQMNCELADAEARANVKRHPYFDIAFVAA